MSRRTNRRHPHHHPPATPAGVLFRHPAVALAVAGASVSLAVLASLDPSPLLTVDEPVQRWVEARRSPWLGEVFRVFSRLGSNILVFSVVGALLLLLARRCRTIALALAVSVLARPPLEYVIKELVDRPRPDLERLIEGTGPSHPTGHVLAAVALWGLLPPIVAALTHRRVWWWVGAIAGLVLVVAIGASRVYLGVHWLTDVVQSLLLGSLYLVAIEAIFIWHHHRYPACSVLEPDHRADAHDQQGRVPVA